MVTPLLASMSVANKKEDTFIASSVGRVPIVYTRWITYFAVSLTDRQNLALKGPHGKTNSLQKSNKPFKDLKKDDLGERTIC
jgi:hypothetical protein